MEFSVDQANNDVQEMIDILITHGTAYGLNVLGALVILILGWIGAGWIQRSIMRALAKTDKIDETLRVFFGSIARYTILAFVILAVLAQFGVQTASLIALFGAAGLAVGFALQGTLSNIAAGVMLLIFRPFKIGDYVDVAGQAGTVRSITLFVTDLATGDNVAVVVPNAQVWGNVVKNFSTYPTRRVELLIGISYEDDIDHGIRAISEVLGGENRILPEPATLVAVSELADSSVNIVVRAWCNSGDYLPMRCDLLKNIKGKFDAEGISIPYPQRMVHLNQSPPPQTVPQTTPQTVQ